MRIAKGRSDIGCGWEGRYTIAYDEIFRLEFGNATLRFKVLVKRDGE